ncbi:hypothetical protein R1sor_015821 [Riccia sorocarpa]|uniref:Large ribosomal subunit protein bL28c n=1 Tax=Riccia sorocarpa TaxID=122646 RepID=A0ABD3HG13_9MARC
MASLCSLSARVQVPAQLSSRSSEVTGAGARSLCASRVTCAPSTSSFLVSPLAGRKCDLTGKKANNGYKVSFSNKRTKKLQQANLQYKRLWWEEGNRFVKLRLSTKALKTVERKGLQAMAKEAGVNLEDFAV